jgi:hypothetical protein
VTGNGFKNVFPTGVRLEFDMAIALDGPSEARRWRGFPSGFELGDSTGTQWQTMTLLGVRDEGNTTVQLNATFAPSGGERNARLCSGRRFLTEQYEKRSVAETHSGQTYRQGNSKRCAWFPRSGKRQHPSSKREARVRTLCVA